MDEIQPHITQADKTRGCPSVEILDLFVSSQLPDKLDQDIEAHVEDCVVCLAYLESKNKADYHLFKMSFGSIRQARDSVYTKPELSGYSRIEYYKAGGQGIVFKAWDEHLNRQVAVKILKDYAGQDSDQESSIIHEARAIARLSHPNVVKVHGLVWTAQGPAMIMDWIEGESLLERLKTKPCVRVESVEMLIKLCDAVELAHDAGILHRDIKPSNILLCQNRISEPMLCDFGLAKLKREDGDFSTSTIGVGTAGYMPPEMISKRHGKISACSDIYSIGAVLYHMLTSRLPHESQSVFETMEKTCEKDVTPPTFFEKEIPRDLETICLKCMHREPEHRYQSVKTLKSDLQKFLDNQPLYARRASTRQKLKLWIREKPWIAGLSASLLGLLISSVILLSYALNRAIQGELKTERELDRTTEILRVSTPLLKHFLQFGILKEDEIRKIQKLSNLIKDVGTDSPNLKQRYDMIYVGLELANGLVNVKGQQDLAFKMTRQARTSLKNLIDDHGPELDRMGHFMVGEEIGISLLDQSMIRYGHSCIQFAHLIQRLNQDSGLIESEPFVDEAIMTAERIIRKNPEVDEAFSDLANYYADKYNILKSKGRNIETDEISRKSEAIQARMMNKYPNDAEKVVFWLISVQNILKNLLNNQVDNLLFHEKITRIKTELNRIKSRNDSQWLLTAEMVIQTLVMEPRFNYRTRPIADLQVEMHNLLTICQELIAVKAPLSTHIQLYLNTGIETIAVLESDNTKHKEALALFHELERHFSKPSDDNLNPKRLAEIYLRSPIPETRSIDKALLFLKNSSTKNSESDQLMNILTLMKNPLFEPTPSDYTRTSDIQMKYAILKAETLLRQGKTSEARAIADKTLDQLQAYQTISLDYQYRLKELNRQLHSAK